MDKKTVHRLILEVKNRLGLASKLMGDAGTTLEAIGTEVMSGNIELDKAKRQMKKVHGIVDGAKRSMAMANKTADTVRPFLPASDLLEIDLRRAQLDKGIVTLEATLETLL